MEANQTQKSDSEELTSEFLLFCFLEGNITLCKRLRITGDITFISNLTISIRSERGTSRTRYIIRLFLNVEEVTPIIYSNVKVFDLVYHITSHKYGQKI
jgi:hypothetical protein